MKPYSKLALYSVTTLLLLTTELTFARAGGVGDAGANGYGFNLLDLVLSDRVTQRTTEEVLQSNPVIIDIMKTADSIAYKFSSNFTNPKQWLFIKGFNKDVSQGCLNFSAIQYVDKEQTVRACQFPTKYILVDEDWFNDPRVSDVVRSALITHEIFVGSAQAAGLYKEETKRTTELDIQLQNGSMYKLYRDRRLTLASLQKIATESSLVSSGDKLIAPGYAAELLNYIYDQGPKVCAIIAKKADKQKLTQDELKALNNVSDALRNLRNAGNSTTDLDMHFSNSTYRLLEKMENSRIGQSELHRYIPEVTQSFCEKMK